MLPIRFCNNQISTSFYYKIQYISRVSNFTTSHLVLAALCVFTHFWVSAQISAVRPLAFGPEGTLDMAARFTQLHQLSLGIFIAVSAATILLVIRHAREDARESGRSGEKPSKAAKNRPESSESHSRPQGAVVSSSRLNEFPL